MILPIALSVFEILLVAAVLAFALLQVSRLLGAISSTLGRVAFGVRAVEQQLSSLGAAVRTANDELTGAVAEIEERADRAELHHS